MHHLNYIFLALIIVTIGSACQKEEAFQPETTLIDQQGFVQGQIREPEQSTFSDFEIELGQSQANGIDLYTFWQNDFSQGALGSTLILGIYPTAFSSSTPLFGLQFWSETLPSDRDWTKEELQSFFAPSTTFEFGQGFGKVDFMLKLPIDEAISAPRPSRASYLAAPQGTLTVTAIEELDYPVYGRSSERRYGLLIHCTFSGQIGRYDSLADQADGDPSFFQTDEIVELENGEAVFYVNYDEQ